MLVLEYFVYIFSAIANVAIFYAFFSSFGKIIEYKTFFRVSFIFVVLNVMSVILIDLSIFFIILMILVIFLIASMFEMSIKKRVLLTLMIYFIIVAMEVIVGLSYSLILGVEIEFLQNNMGLHIIIVLTINLLLYAIIRIFKQYKTSKSNMINCATIPLFSLMPISTIFMLYVITNRMPITYENVEMILLIAASIFMVASNFAVFFLYDYMLKQEEKKNDAQKLSVKLELEKEFYRELTAQSVNENKYRHDIKNQLFAIKAFMDSDLQVAKDKISKICGNFDQNSIIAVTGIESVDGLIFTKAEKAKEKNISINTKGIVLKNYQLDEIDLCVIIGNLLDNSIEACEKIENKDNRFIMFECQQINNYLSLTIVNSILDTTQLDFDLRTTKKNKKLHGFGIKNVKEIIKKYDGVMDCGVVDNSFKINIVFPLNGV